MEPLLATGSSRGSEGGAFLESDAVVCGSEIRAAAAAALQNPYPPSAHAGVFTQEEPRQEEDISSTGCDYSAGFGVRSLHEEEIRELLLEHVSQQCCWSRQPVWAWQIQKVEDCNAFIATLETFVEERDVVEQSQPYDGRRVAESKLRVPGCWEIDTSAAFPPLFVQRKTELIKLPNSETVEKCAECMGRGKIDCPVCTTADEKGVVSQKKQFTCSRCSGRGLIAHLDGSDSNCKECRGSGQVPCSNCHSRGVLRCERCQSRGAFFAHKNVRVKWTTLLHRKVVASSHAASVPDEVFQQAKGVQIVCSESQMYQQPPRVGHPTLDKLSEETVRERPPLPPSARIIAERHRITLVPVTRVVMSDEVSKKKFSFYVVGLKNKVYMKRGTYPARCCCSIL